MKTISIIFQSSYALLTICLGAVGYIYVVHGLGCDFVMGVLALADTEELAAGILDMQKTALLLFAGYVDAATPMAESHGGGGSTPSSSWGRDKDEDEREWERRCARMAMEMSRPQKRGWRR